MKNLVLVKRYSEGLVRALDSVEEFNQVKEELQSFNHLLSRSTQLNRVLATPIASPAKRKEVLHSLFRLWPGFLSKTKRFLSLLVEQGRLGLLPEIIGQLPAIWNDEHGIVTFDIFSTVPLTTKEKKVLKEKLEKLEGSPVDLHFHLDPHLIGGISVKKGNIIYDLSIQGSLELLKQHLIKG